MEQNLKDIELRSEEVQEILSKVPNWMVRWGSLLFLSLIILLLAISYFIKYPDVISCEALVTTTIPPEKIYARTTGKISSILLKNEDEVLQNTPIAILENSANYKDVFLLKSIVDTLKVNTKYFEFPFEGLPILYLGDVNTAFILFENSYSEYLLNKKLNPFANEKRANEVSILELKRRLLTTIQQKKIRQKELNLQEKLVERQEKLYGKEIISLQEFENKKRDLLKSERDLTSIQLNISQLKEQISNAKKNDNSTISNRTKEEVRLFKNVIQSFNQLKIELKNWERNYVLKSGINGIVSFLNFWSSNQSVSEGDLMFTVVPKENSNYIVKANTLPFNTGKIKKGQRVSIRLESYPEEEFGVLTGRVNKVSLTPDKNGFYIIDISLPNDLTTSYKKVIDFKQEMTGQAEIITEDLRLIERFFYQLKKATSR